jgi:hypothetical protein
MHETKCVGGEKMKRLSLIVTLSGLFALGAYQVQARPPQDNAQENTDQRTNGQKAKDDAKGAGHDTKNAAKKTGTAVKNGSKKAANEGAKGVKKGADKTSEGAGKLEDKTQDHKNRDNNSESR